MTKSKKDDKKAKKSHHKPSKSKHKKDPKKEKKHKHDKKIKKEKTVVSSSSQIDPLAASSSLVSQNQRCISEEDYFLKNVEFRLWLKQNQSRNFEDLGTEEARRIFTEEFMALYNSGRLDSMFYANEGVSRDMKRSIAHTQHQWNLRLNRDERDKLEDLSYNIDHLTNTTKTLI